MLMSQTQLRFVSPDGLNLELDVLRMGEVALMGSQPYAYQAAVTEPGAFQISKTSSHNII